MTTKNASPATAGESHRVELTQTGESYTCLPNENMLQGMARLGRRGIPIGCLNGGCGICKVAVETGEWQSTGPMSRAHVSAEEEARGVVLACRATPCTDIRITVLGKMQKGLFKGWGEPAAALAAAAIATTTDAG
jgi:3-phenylpropionate/trans-cinnamate dioxygenase ferredoxin reductase subunit